MEPKANCFAFLLQSTAKTSNSVEQEGIKKIITLSLCWVWWQSGREKAIKKLKKNEYYLANGKNNTIDEWCVVKLCVKINKLTF